MSEPLRLTLTTAPDKMPVTLAQAKLAARLDDGFVDDDALVAGMIRVATEEFERYTGLAGVTRTYTVFLDSWPASRSPEVEWEGWRQGAETIISKALRRLELPRPPLQSVTFIKTYDDADAATTYAASNYFVDIASRPGRVVLRTSAAAPNPDRVANGVEIQFVAGYGNDPGDVPEAARAGITNLVAYLNEHRGDCDMGEAIAESGAGMLWGTLKVARL